VCSSDLTINQDLDRAAIEYVNSPRGILIRDNKLIVSQIYQWYSSDFANNDKEIIHVISKFANPVLKQQIQKFSTIDSYEYDWSLNIQP
jgi:hypothetical protein